MEHEMDVAVEEEMLLDSDPDTRARGEQASSQDNLSFLPNPGSLLRPRQRTRQPDPARPWKSLPATPTGEMEKDQTVFFSSLSSLQAEEFFDMVAKVQARRLNDQRADFAGAEEMCAGSTRVAEEQLYDTILTHQSQRLEDQRTEPPIPLGIQGLLDLLLKAQGTRMEDQRSVLPPSLAAPSMLRGHSSFPMQCMSPPPDPSLQQLWF
ncbi:G-protein-signaling modulator 3 [Rhineura floridana]|uniref:G-protein-signaling modulator 3 n=1 Tax=Rhineura floridana TaxID=261503 RepID=UPI002AC874A3|nr:G-protein-signaling modulator 3 [Rhineura floridana]XP_061475735.1 G-protein-signaling modulator 3 [Rhineura floridana]XP_061475736.1 G-protein-signaling modulator 3 [Rhineura floridana]XP_061475737.1 G-protein-signaling modulator 3 [Rhineura floridana]XP_061475738.1 G-protein-signaling modulator 3 [Rhineura floridana]